jgi:hypothetical protein
MKNNVSTLDRILYILLAVVAGYFLSFAIFFATTIF